MFPGANAQVYRNEAGEPIGWDYPSYDDGDYYDDYYENWEAPEFETVEECIEAKLHAIDGYGENDWWVCEYCNTPFALIEED